MKIFVIHARRTGYGVIRALHTYTDEIYVADSHKTAVFSSRHVKQGFVCSDITTVSDEAFLEEVIELAHQMDYQKERPVVFTGKDDYLQFFSKYSDVLSKYFLLSFESDYAKLNKALSKLDLIDIANQAKVKIPLSWSSKTNLSEILSQVTYPAIIKPAVKNAPEIDVVKQAFRIKVCEKEKDLREAAGLLESLSVPYVVQEYIPGDDSELFTIGVYSWRGELKAWSTSQKIRQFPPSTGECSYGRTLHLEALVEPARRILKAIGLTGISQIEFKYHRGEYYLIEINPRVWSWHQIHTKVGVNLAKVAMDCIYGQVNDHLIEPRKEERFWMFLMMDLLHNRLLNRNLSWVQLCVNFLRSDLEAFFSWKDPMPFIIHTWQTIPYIKQQLKNG